MSPPPGVRLGDALITASLVDDDAAMCSALDGADVATLMRACIYLARSHARMWIDISEHQGDDPLGSWAEALLERESR